MVNKPPPLMPQQPMPQMPMPPMNQPQAPSGGGFMSQLASSPMMRRPMPGGPGKGRSRGRRPMPGGPGKGRGQPQQPMPFSPMMNRFNPALQGLTQGPMNMPQLGNNPPAPPPPLSPPPTNQRQAPSGGFFLGNMLNNAMSQGQIGQPQQSFMGRVANNMPQPPRIEPSRIVNQGPRPLPLSTMGFYGGGITDLY